MSIKYINETVFKITFSYKNEIILEWSSITQITRTSENYQEQPEAFQDGSSSHYSWLMGQYSQGINKL